MVVLAWLVLVVSGMLPQAALPSAPAPSNAAVERAAAAASETKGPRSEPILIYQVDPELSERARKKRFSGNVDVAMLVDKNGVPQDVIVVKGVGFGLDEKAVDAVRQYRFKPALDADGKPVAKKMTVSVNFQIF